MPRSIALSIAVFAASILTFRSAPAQGDPPPKDIPLEIREELDRLKKRVEELEKKLEELTGKLKEGKKPAEGDPGEEEAGPKRARFKEADHQALQKITLPEKPTRENVVEYVRAVAEATKGQNSFSSEDPQSEMLMKVGSRHVDVLLQQWNLLHYYLVPVITQLATEEHKKLILDALRTRKDLVEVVVKKGWIKDATKVLVEEMRGAKEYLPKKWMEAVASLKDPTANRELLAYFINGPNKRGAYEALRSVSGIDLDKAVVEAWAARNRVRIGMVSFPAQDELIPIAIRHGVREALDLGFEKLWKPDARDYAIREIKEAILATTDARGSDQEILGWYEQNKKSLRWDASKKKYRGR